MTVAELQQILNKYSKDAIITFHKDHLIVTNGMVNEHIPYTGTYPAALYLGFTIRKEKGL